MSNFTLASQIEVESVFVHDLPLCQLRLFRQKAVLWLCLIPRRGGMRELYQLDAPDRAQLMDEIVLVSKLVERLFTPEKINVAALGNMVPQLHIHIVGRFKDDPAWPGPIWGRLPPHERTSDELEQLKADIVSGLST